MSSLSASQAFDQRIVEVDIVLPGQTITLSNQNPSLTIYTEGSKFGCALQNTCTCRIFNLAQAVRNQILTLASPLIGPPKNNPAFGDTPQSRPILNLRVGRQSTGTFLLFSGVVLTCEMTQPPDIGIVLRSLTNAANAYFLYDIQFPANTLLSAIAEQIATQNGLTLDFEATDRQIGNYSYTGALKDNIQKLNEMGGIWAGADNNTLWVVNAGTPRKNTGYTISETTGMVGIPQVTDQGVVVRTMINSAIQIGGEVTIDSQLNIAANGTFPVVKMDYEIASRDQPFWYTLLCSNINLVQGTQ